MSWPWQLLVSLVGVTLSGYLMLWLAGGAFRASQLLLSNAPFSWQRLWSAWRQQPRVQA